MSDKTVLESALSGMFCEDGRKIFLDHLKACPDCRRGIRLTLEGLPFVKMMLPSDALENMMKLLEEK